MTFPKLPPVIVEKVIPAVKNRPAAAALTVGGLVAVIAMSFAGGPSTLIAQLTPQQEADIREHAQAILDILDEEPTTTTMPATTTTNAPTTTTTAAPTTTTVAPTTTTTGTPPTTTTTGPLPTPTGEKYDFFVNVLGVGRAWTAPYFRTLPYAPGSGWADGNRDGYKCAYGILMWNGGPVGRVTFSRVSGAAAYTIINDKGMPDNGDTLRHYDTGSLFPQPVTQGECPPPIEAYSPSTEPAQFPVIDYIGPEGQLLERRDYRKLDDDGPLPPQLKFRLTSVSAVRVTVVAYWENNPFVVIYYDSPYGADVTMNGYIP